jgi:hypothetical protein
LREHFADDAIGEQGIHQDRVRLGIEGRPVAPFQLDQGRRVSLDDPAKQVGIRDQRPLDWLWVWHRTHGL